MRALNILQYFLVILIKRWCKLYTKLRFSILLYWRLVAYKRIVADFIFIIILFCFYSIWVYLLNIILRISLLLFFSAGWLINFDIINKVRSSISKIQKFLLIFINGALLRIFIFVFAIIQFLYATFSFCVLHFIFINL